MCWELLGELWAPLSIPSAAASGVSLLGRASRLVGGVGTSGRGPGAADGEARCLQWSGVKALGAAQWGWGPDGADSVGISQQTVLLSPGKQRLPSLGLG